MSNQDSKSPARTHDPSSKPTKTVEKDLDQTVRHASGQALGNKERLSPTEAAKLAGDTKDDTKP